MSQLRRLYLISTVLAWSVAAFATVGSFRGKIVTAPAGQARQGWVFVQAPNGRMRLVDIRPDSSYLSGATGPKAGAKKLWGNRPVAELTRLADQTARAIGVPIAVFEDALCNWQK